MGAGEIKMATTKNWAFSPSKLRFIRTLSKIFLMLLKHGPLMPSISLMTSETSSVLRQTVKFSVQLMECLPG
jgi:hypothetical protein